MVRRFDCKIFVGVPGKFGRIAMIKKFLTGVDYSITEREFQEIARQTFGWSGSDIEVSVLPLEYGSKVIEIRRLYHVKRVNLSKFIFLSIYLSYIVVEIFSDASFARNESQFRRERNTHNHSTRLW